MTETFEKKLEDVQDENIQTSKLNSMKDEAKETKGTFAGIGEIANDIKESLESIGEKQEHQNIYDVLEEDIMNADISEAEKARRLSNLVKLRGQKVNVMLAGATGSGKSSTVNALFDMEVAKVGVGVDPETMSIDKYELENLVIWDTPGLGDGIENDKRVAKEIIHKLNETDENGEPLIDIVLVVLDASSKDLGTSYELINNVLIPCIGEDAEKRILVGLNQADIAMKGKHWRVDENEPDEVLEEFLAKKSQSVRNRIKEATNLDIRPICYCAGYKEEGKTQCRPYNLTKLLYYIVNAIPRNKRLALIDNINQDEDNWLYDDKEVDYKSEIKRSFFETVWEGVADGAETGSEIGQSILGIPGYVIGGAVGAAFGAIGGVISAIFG